MNRFINTLKKSICIFLIPLFLSSFVVKPTFAAENYIPSECDVFLGLTSWNCDVEIKDEETLKTGIWKIVANVATDITVIAAYLILGYVIYGGYRYIFSAGDPNKVATGKKTLFHAFIGLAIVMSAYAIISTIRFALLGNAPLTDCIHQKCITDTDLIANSIQWIIGVSGLVAVIFVVYGGILYITSSGDSNKVQKAKSMILYALIGLAIVALAEVLTAFVSSKIREANEAATSYTNNITISKEVHEIKTTN